MGRTREERNLETCEPGEEGHIYVRGECVRRLRIQESHMKEDPNIKAITPTSSCARGTRLSMRRTPRSLRALQGHQPGGEKISPMEVEDVLMKHPRRQHDLLLRAARAVGRGGGRNCRAAQRRMLDLMALRSFALKRGMMKQWWPTMVIMDAIPKGDGQTRSHQAREKLQLPAIKSGDAGCGNHRVA